jgi:hypothetical protein
MVMAPLPASPRAFSALMPLHEDQRCNEYSRRADETKRVQRKPAPVKKNEVARPHENGGKNNNEERAVHGKKFVYPS